MRKRAVIIRALAQNPDIIYMDEPFGPLDVFTREKLQGEILKMWMERKIQLSILRMIFQKRSRLQIESYY